MHADGDGRDDQGTAHCSNQEPRLRACDIIYHKGRRKPPRPGVYPFFKGENKGRSGTRPLWWFTRNHPDLSPASTMAFHHLHLYVLLEPTRTTCNNNFFFRAAHEEAVGTRPSRTALMRFGLPRDEVGARPLPFARFPTFWINQFVFSDHKSVFQVLTLRRFAQPPLIHRIPAALPPHHGNSGNKKRWMCGG